VIDSAYPFGWKTEWLARYGRQLAHLTFSDNRYHSERSLDAGVWAAFQQQTPHLVLQELTFSMQLSSETMAELVTVCKAAPKLRRLSLQASVRSASSLSELTQLNTLQMSEPYQELTAAGFTALGCLTFLSRLILVGYRIAFPIGSGFQAVSHLKQLTLKDMDFHRLRIPPADATLQLSQSLAHLTSLIHLDVTRFPDGAAACLSALPSLRSLQDLVFKGNLINLSQLSALSHLTCITFMALSGKSSYDPINPESLPPSLQHLELDSCSISSLAGLAKLQQLTYLSGDCNEPSSCSCSCLSKLQQLRHLSLRPCCASEALVAAAQLSRLEHFHLGVKDESDHSYGRPTWPLHWRFCPDAWSGKLQVMDGTELYGGAVYAGVRPKLDRSKSHEVATFPSLAGWGRLKDLQLSLDSLPDPAAARTCRESPLAADLNLSELTLVSSNYRSGVGFIGVSAFKWVRELDLSRCQYLSSGAFSHLSLLTALTKLLISEEAVWKCGVWVSNRDPKRATLAQDTRVWVKPSPPGMDQSLGYGDCSDIASSESGGGSSRENSEDEGYRDKRRPSDLAVALVALYKGKRSLPNDSRYDSQLQEECGVCGTAGVQCLSSNRDDRVLEGCSHRGFSNETGMKQGASLPEGMEIEVNGGNEGLGVHGSDTDGSTSSGSESDGMEVDAEALQVPTSSSRSNARLAKRPSKLQSLLDAEKCPLWDLSCLPQLQHLEMTGCNVTEAPCFSALQRLTYLAAGGNQFSSIAIWDIGKQLLQLQHLDLQYGMFPYVHDACSCLGDLTKLTHLHLSAQCGSVRFWYRFCYNAFLRCVQTDTTFPPAHACGAKHTCVEAAARDGGS
jgi:Leucine-rich repeat (LRR) protein